MTTIRIIKKYVNDLSVNSDCPDLFFFGINENGELTNSSFLF